MALKNLETETIYTLGKFNVILNEQTGDLKVTVHTVSESLQVQPKTDNCIIIQAKR